MPMQKISRHSDEISHDTHLACSLTHHATNWSDQQSTARIRSPQDNSSVGQSVRQKDKLVVSDADAMERGLRARATVCMACSHALVVGASYYKSHFGHLRHSSHDPPSPEH